MKRSEVVKVAEELTQVLGLEPKINLKAPVQSLKDKIIEAATLINPQEDEFSDETWEALQTIGALSKPQAAAVVETPAPAPVEKAVAQSEAKAEAKKEKPAPKKADTAKDTGDEPFTSFVDNLLKRGGTWEELAKKVSAESTRRGLKTQQRLGELKAHVKYRIKQGANITFDGDKVVWKGTK